MENSVNKYIDIESLRWGMAPTPLLPESLLNLWMGEELPEWVCQETGLPSHSTIDRLGKEFWTQGRKVTTRVENFLKLLVTSRGKEVFQTKCFNFTWPKGLKLSDLPFSVRTRNRLKTANLHLNKTAVFHDLTFDGLFRIPGFGVTCVLEFTTIVEAANSAMQQLTEAFTPDLFHENSSMAEEIRAALSYDWADQVSDNDPRFASMLSPGNGSLLERIEASFDNSGSFQALASLPALAGSIVRVREEVARIQQLQLESSLMDLLSRLMRGSNERIVAMADRLGWRGQEPKTLDECGSMISVTRERMRQIESKMKGRVPGVPIFLPQLDLAIKALEEAAPIDLAAGAALLRSRHISHNPFSPISVIQAAEILHREPTLSILETHGKKVVVAGTTPRPLRRAAILARKLAGQSGVTSIFQVANLCDDKIDENDVRKLLHGFNHFEFLNDDWLWATDLPILRNRLCNVTNKILSVVAPQSISSIREGVRRAYRWRLSTGGKTFANLVVPPIAVMREFYRRHPDFRQDGDMIEPVKPLDYRKEMGEVEQTLVDVLRLSPAGLLDRQSIITKCVDHGINEATASTFLTYSPIIEHLDIGLWKLRGVVVSPEEVIVAREQNQFRPKEKTFFRYGWTPDGKLWIASVLPTMMQSLVIYIPAAIGRFLHGQSFNASAKESTKAIATISISESGQSYGYYPYLRFSGADSGDVLLAEFDLSKNHVALSLASEDDLDSAGQ